MEKNNATNIDDPIDDCTKWIGKLPKEDTKEPKHPPKCNPRGVIKPNL